MTKPRKLHQLKGIINHAWLGTSKSKTYQNQPFYYLDITQISLFTKSEAVLYAFSNLVSPEIWTALEQNTFKDKQFLFTCEKRTRGWRLKAWAEIE